MLLSIFIYFTGDKIVQNGKQIQQNGGKMKTLRKKELEILAYLRNFGRHTVTQIGKKLNIPRTTVFDKIKKFKKLGLINRFTAIVDFNQLGQSVCAYIMFKCDSQKKAELADALATSMHTNNVVKLGNDFDFMASMVFAGIEDMHSYLDILAKNYGIKETKILYVAKDLKREGFMASSLISANQGDGKDSALVEKDDSFKEELDIEV